VVRHFRLGSLFDGPAWRFGDVDGDGQVDAADLDFVFQDVGFGVAEARWGSSEVLRC
jgi:hypothetical protein